MRTSRYLDVRAEILLLIALPVAVYLNACVPVPIPVGAGKPIDVDESANGTAIVLIADQDDELSVGTLEGLELRTEKIALGIDHYPLDLAALPILRHAVGVSVAADPEGNPHFVYPQERDETCYLMHGWRADDNWGSEEIGPIEPFCGDLFGTPFSASIDFDAAGTAHVAWIGYDYEAHCLGFRYAVREEGTWEAEPLTPLLPCDDCFYWADIELEVAGDGVMAVAVGTGGVPEGIADLGSSCTSIYFAHRHVGEGWNAERIHYEESTSSGMPPKDKQSTMRCSAFLNGLSLAMGPGGEKAVGFICGKVCTGVPYETTVFHVMTNLGGGWAHEGLDITSSHLLAHRTYLGAPDIDFDPGGRLHATWARSWDPVWPVASTSYIVHRVREGTEWTRGMDWDNSVLPAGMLAPSLLLGASSKPVILCGGWVLYPSTANYLCLLSQWRDPEPLP